MDRSQLDFTLALHEQLPAAGNLAWSPYSVASALGLAAEGARGRTRDELVGLLAPGRGSSGGELAALARLLTGAARLGDAEFAVANTLWTQAGLEFTDAYRRAVLDWPGGALHTADFARDPEGSRGQLNADVEKTTQGLVRDLLSPGSITTDTVAVLVNALYLKAAWRHAFAERDTRPAVFHAPSGSREVPTMRQVHRLPHAAAGGWRLVTLASAAEIVLDVLLPDPAGAAGRGDSGGDSGAGGPGLPGTATLTELYRRAAGALVELELPRFRVEASPGLTGPLERLGVSTAFTRDADFSGISASAPVRIDGVAHRAVLRVDEKGLEGAAATAVMFTPTALEIGSPVPFHVDRPFLVLVRHPGTGAVYFVARVVEP